jgi:folate-binding protein YgfZ
MSPLLLHDFHAARGALFSNVNGLESVSSYGSESAEYEALTASAALIDLSFRSRICLLGPDREKFLHGQVTNEILRLNVGQGTYAALVTAKGKMESDLFVYKLKDELLLDFEPGLTQRVTERLNRYVIAEDVQIVDVAPHYGLLSVIGPKAANTLHSSRLPVPDTALSWISNASESGEIYVVNNPRFRIPAFDLFVPLAQMLPTAQSLEQSGTRWAGFDALETVRIENGIPRFGVDMSENTLPQEAELQDRAISFAKGCYIGQEVIARIRTYGQVAKALRLLQVNGALPAAGTKVFAAGKEVGFITSATHSPKHHADVALAYIRKESNSPGTALQIGSAPTTEAVILPSADKP